MRLAWIVGMLLAVAASEAAGQQNSGHPPRGFSDLARAPLRTGGPYLSVVHDRDGEPLLVVDYPWAMHAQPSIEVATLPAKRADRSEVRPLYFFDRFFHGRSKIAVYTSQDASAEVPTRTHFTDAEIHFDVLGDRNSLGRPSARVASQTQVEEIAQVVDRAFFCLLAPWAINGRTLQLDLPRTQFAKPGQIRVWFLRGDAVVWSEDAAWPGYAE